MNDLRSAAALLDLENDSHSQTSEQITLQVKTYCRTWSTLQF